MLRRPPPFPNARSVAAPAAVAAAALAAGLGAPLLLWLSRFGQHPYATLPLPVVLLFGALFTGLLVEAVAHRPGPRSMAVLAVAGTAGAAASLAFPFTGPHDALAPLAATALALLLRAAAPRRSRMLAAMSVYVGCTLLANYTFDSFLPVGPFLLVNVGTLFFGVTFTQRDRVHRYGRGPVYGMIVIAAGANVALAAGLGTPLRYVGVSFLSILLSETVDTEIYQRLLGRRWLVRVASSNGVSAPLDTLVFTLLAFVGQDFATPRWLLQVIATDVIVKYASSLAAALGVSTLPRAVARAPHGVAGPEPS